MTFISRRDLLKRTVGAAAAGPVARAFQSTAVAAGERSAESFAVQANGAREALENLTATEMDVLEAVVARLIPSAERGPGAHEARAAHYIDRALGGALSSSRQAYTAGLAALDRYA